MNDGMEDFPLSLGSALVASPPAKEPEFTIAVDCTQEFSTIQTTKGNYYCKNHRNSHLIHAEDDAAICFTDLSVA